MRNLISIILFLMNSTIFLFGQETGQDTKTYRVTRTLRFQNIGFSNSYLILYLPLPPSNSSQIVGNYDTKEGKIFLNPGTEDKYVRYLLTGNQIPELNKWGEVSYEFDYTEITSWVDINKIDSIFPYDTSSTIYKMYTQKKYEFIDTENQTIKNIADMLWTNSNNLSEYIKQSFDYVYQNFSYKDPGTGFHTISYLVANGGGDCGNLSSLFISLLRCKNIPARHVIKWGHVWAEFYLEKYGWIPADETFGYFGKAPSGWGIAWASEIVFYLSPPGADPFYLEDLGQIHFFLPSHDPFNCIDTVKYTEIKPTSINNINDRYEIPEKFELYQNYPNPFNPSTTINFMIPVVDAPRLRRAQSSRNVEVPITLKVYDLLGHEIATLVNDYKSPGSYEVIFDGTALSSGIYFYQMRTENQILQKKMLMIK